MSLSGNLFFSIAGALFSQIFNKCDLLSFIEQGRKIASKKKNWNQALLDADEAVCAQYDQKFLAIIDYPEKIDINWIIECLSNEHKMEQNHDSALGFPKVLVEPLSNEINVDPREVVVVYVEALLTSLGRADLELRSLLTWTNTDSIRKRIDFIAKEYSEKLDQLTSEIKKLVNQSIEDINKDNRSKIIRKDSKLNSDNSHIIVHKKSIQYSSNFDQKKNLVEILLSCQSVKDQQTRDAIVNELNKDIRNTIKRSTIDLVDISNIVNRCMEFDLGIMELIEVVRFFEGNSIGMQKIDEFLRF